MNLCHKIILRSHFHKALQGAKMQCLQRTFGIYLGSGKMMWSTLGRDHM